MPMDFGPRLDTRKRTLVQLHRVAIVGGSFSDLHRLRAQAATAGADGAPR